MEKFSEDVALFLYSYKRENLKLDGDEIVKLAVKNKINLSELELKGKSLLNRDGAGNFKFAHKSILEFFLAKHAITNVKFGEGVLYFRGIEGFDQAAKFCEELMFDQLWYGKNLLYFKAD